MISLTSVEPPFQIHKGTVYMVKWVENWESLKVTQVLIDGKEFTVKDVDRNRCSTFFFRTDEEWEKRDVAVLV